jgi:hypothetical protein
MEGQCATLVPRRTSLPKPVSRRQRGRILSSELAKQHPRQPHLQRVCLASASLSVPWVSCAAPHLPPAICSCFVAGGIMVSVLRCDPEGTGAAACMMDRVARMAKHRNPASVVKNTATSINSKELFLAQVVELHSERGPQTGVEHQGDMIVATGWLSDPRHLQPGVILCLHGDPFVAGRFLGRLPPAADGRLRLELMPIPGARSWRGRGGPKAGRRWVGEDQRDLPTLSLELSPYEGDGNPPFLPLAPGEAFNYPLPSSLHPYAAPTRSSRQCHFERDLARIVAITGNRVVPYAFRDMRGSAFRMTATAIDFAAANLFISSPYGAGGPVRYVTVTADIDTTLTQLPIAPAPPSPVGQAQGTFALD